MTNTMKLLKAIEGVHIAAQRAVRSGLPPEDVEAITAAVSAAITSLTTIYRVSADGVECAGCQLDLLDSLRTHLLNCADIVDEDMAMIAEEHGFEQIEMDEADDAPLLH